ncbi:DNA polymerase beta superfamily protein [Streptomyces montanisoli]|uniref:Nucleotidyltransferase domain-containing protein n=1 Tax=Streptomyces montanisoli TaxID=2798581 RepID=A0A940RWE8_9ACTN|nr:nucleotidyltransferase domain-containing protein [Streptomyces montanisoli]MBP0456534.1 nucleotidyltransferase domain-containing protein [Streptomyces montanisoli]
MVLSGIVGSTAYGLARPGSDIDRLGVFAVPTEALHGLHRPQESHVTHEPDRALHEAAKWARLALRANPTVLELVWLTDELYDVRTALGDELIGIRSAFLSASRVRAAYLGYATQQFKRLYDRRGSSSSADVHRRTAKHARHLRRLCHQGYHLYATGRLDIRVDDPDSYFAFGEEVARDAMAALPMLQDFEARFDRTVSPLPDRPDEAPVEAWLLRVRAQHCTREKADA